MSITVVDNFAFNGFRAPATYLGNKSGAFGGSILFELDVAAADGPDYTPLGLFGAGLQLWANRMPPPLDPTNFTVSLVGSSFYLGDPYAGPMTVATDAQLLSVLGNLDVFSIQADWLNGGDFVRLDTVSLNGIGGPTIGAVPEPASWAMMIIGFGVVGSAMRRGSGRTLVRS